MVLLKLTASAKGRDEPSVIFRPTVCLPGVMRSAKSGSLIAPWECSSKASGSPIGLSSTINCTLPDAVGWARALS